MSISKMNDKSSKFWNKIGNLKFIGLQSFHHIKKHWLLGVTFAICFSSIASLVIIGDSLEQAILLDIMDDLEEANERIYLYYNTRDINWSKKPDFDQEFFTKFEELEIGTIKSVEKQANVEMNEYEFYTNSTNHSTYMENVTDYSSYAAVLFGNEEFYEDPLFNLKIKILNGTFPKANNEIIVDILFADIFNYSIGNEYLLNYSLYDYHRNSIAYTDSQFPLKVVGIYAVNDSGAGGVYLNGFNFWPQYEYNFENSTFTDFYYQEYDNITEMNQRVPVMSYFNYTSGGDSGKHAITHLLDHPAIKLHDIRSNTWDYDLYDIFYRVDLGLDFLAVDFSQLEAYLDDLGYKLRELEIDFEDELNIHSGNLEWILLWRLQEINIIQLILPIFNIPLLIFSLIMGSITIKNETDNRLDEFLMLRSKGLKNRVLRREILTETSGLVVISAIFGTILGFPLFFSMKSFIFQLTRIFTQRTVDPVLSISPFKTTVIFSLFSSIIVSIASIIYVARIRAYKMQREIGQDGLESHFSERSLYHKHRNEDLHQFEIIQKAKLKETPLVRNQAYYSKEDAHRVKNKKTLDNLYKKSLKRQEKITAVKKRRKLSWISIIIGIIPVFLTISAFIGLNDWAPDFLQNMVKPDEWGEVMIFNILPFILILTPFFLTAGLIRFIGIEKPQIFAKLFQKISQPVIGNLSKLLGIEAIRKRQYTKICSLIAVFMSILAFSNLFIYSFMGMNLYYYQAEAGSDMNIIFPKTHYDDGNILHLASYENISDFEADMLNFTDFQNKSIFKSLTTVATETTFEIEIPMGEDWYSYTYEEVGFVNFTALYHLLTEGNKYIPDERLKILKNLSPMTDDGRWNCITTSDYATFRNFNAKDDITINHNAFNNITNRTNIQTIDVHVAEIIDYLPGIWSNDRNGLFRGWGNKNYLSLLDISALQEIDHTLSNFTIGIFSEFADDFQFNSSLGARINSFAANITEKWGFDYFNTNYYIHDLSELTQFEDEGEVELDIKLLINQAFLFEFTVIGILLSVGTAILFISFQKGNRDLNGILIARGYGKRGILKFVLTLLISLILFAIVVGGMLGLLSGLLAFRIMNQIEYISPYSPSNLPIEINWSLILINTATTLVSSVGVYLLYYFIESRKSVTKYMRRF